MTLFSRLPALSAACVLLLLAIAAPDGARAEVGGAAAAPAASRDNPASLRDAFGKMFSVRPRARDEAEIPAATEPLNVAALDAMPHATGDENWRCLAQAIYFESRGEPLEGQVAVAEVVLNRVDDRQFPKTVCAVTNQGVGSGRACQFSYACDGRPENMNGEARIRSEKLATLMLAGRPRTVTDGATYFHTRAVRPGWARKMTRTTAIGHHYFYRPATQVASN